MEHFTFVLCLSHLRTSLTVLVFFCWQGGLFPCLQAQPAGFSDEVYVGNFVQAVGFTFDANNRMFVWEKGGKVWIVNNGVKAATPLLDISEEVGNWRDFGLLGFALDPNFLVNGYIYLLYLADRHHLLHYGTPSYNSFTNEYYDATIGRITRYTAQASTNFTTVDYNSRQVLIGATLNTGFPSLHQSHGIGSLVFGSDGTLLASFGDGASYSSVDEGSAAETYYAQAITDGIITSAENVGAYRSQMLTMLSGKIIRIDPTTGNGLSSNPFWTGTATDIQSKVWARGLRNPCRMVLRPGTGSHNPADGDPGSFYIGDVGWGEREELDVCDAPGMNFGWPKYEGMDVLTGGGGYNNATYAPSTHDLPRVHWRGANAQANINGNIYNAGSAQFPGPNFTGNCSMGGVWYTGTDFPAEYQNTYFHADYGGDWIKNFGFDGNDNPIFVKDFKAGADAVVFVGTHPVEGGLLYIGGASGSGTSTSINSVHRISYGDNNLNPTAVIKYDQRYGNSPLTVNFKGNQSTDPENKPLSFAWNFGDGSPVSNEINPSHTFTAPGATPTPYTVTLTVTDDVNQSSQETVVISVNNTPPQIVSTSIDNTHSFSMTGQTNLALSAVVSDLEHTSAELSFAWQTTLYHDNHTHAEPIDTNPNTNTIISPVGCDDVLYFYRVGLTVSDPAGLDDVVYQDLYPDCGGPTARNDTSQFLFDDVVLIPVLDNDLANGTAINASTVSIVQYPAYGSVSVNSSTGVITYTHYGEHSLPDRFTYKVKDLSGDESAVALVSLSRGGPAAALISDPAQNEQLVGTEVAITYAVVGNVTGDELILLSLNGVTPDTLYAHAGSFTYNGVSIGSHRVIMRLANENGVPLPHPEARDTVDFSTLDAGGGLGLKATYFDEINLTNPTLMRLDPELDFDWGAGSPDPQIGVNTFSIRWEGYVQALYSEAYSFHFTADDGIRLWVNNTLIIDAWVDQAPTTYSGQINLIAGQKVPITIEYYENAGGAVAKLEWSSLSQSYEVVPRDYLFPCDCGPEFRDNNDFSVNGNASAQGGGSDCYTLTPASTQQTGSIWFGHKLDLSSPFSLQFWAQFGDQDGGADGLTFLLQRSPGGLGAVGGAGGGLGASGLSPAFGVEFDTYFNTGGPDINDDHLAVFANGNLNNPLVASDCIDKDCQDVEDGSDHEIVVLWDPATQLFEVYVNQQQRISYTSNIVANYFNNDPLVYFGFSAATGGFVNLHQVCLQSMNGSLDPTTFPLELLDFQAREEGAHIALSWITAQEQNTDYFAIERSLDQLDYDSLGRVSAAGYSSQLLEYGFLDPEPLAGRSYYRLRMVDWDGSFSYSPTVEVSLGGRQLHVYPNPVGADRQLYIEIHADQPEPLRIQVLTLQGQVLAEQFMQSRRQHINTRLNLKEAAAGLYLLRIEGESSVQVRKVTLD